MYLQKTKTKKNFTYISFRCKIISFCMYFECCTISSTKKIKYLKANFLYSMYLNYKHKIYYKNCLVKLYVLTTNQTNTFWQWESKCCLKVSNLAVLSIAVIGYSINSFDNNLTWSYQQKTWSKTIIFILCKNWLIDKINTSDIHPSWVGRLKSTCLLRTYPLIHLDNPQVIDPCSLKSKTTLF